MENNGIPILGVTLSAWIYAPVIFLVWLACLYAVKGFFFRALRKWQAAGPRNQLGDFLIQSLGLPLNLLILSGGLALLERLLPLPAEFDEPTTTGLKVLAIALLFYFFDRLVVQLLHHFAGKVQAIDLSRGIIQGLVRLAILSLGLLILLDALGISITPLIASLGIGSLAVALGIQETLTNLFAGLYIVADQPIRTGDFIRLESGEEGYVAEIGWRNTRIRMLSNNVVVVPNNKIISSTIRNYYLPTKEVAVLMEVGVHYASDLRHVEAATIEVARQIQKAVQGAVANFEPFIRYHTFGESSINFTVILRALEFTDQYLLKHEFIKALHERYQKEGIVIPFPIRTLEIPPKTLEELASSGSRKSEPA